VIGSCFGATFFQVASALQSPLSYGFGKGGLKVKNVTDARSMFSNTDWIRIPLKLRQQFWQETKYGKIAPSDELLQKIKEVLDAR